LLVIPALAGAVKDLFVVVDRYLHGFVETLKDRSREWILARRFFNVNVRE
jgi:hypothetical protein